MPSRQPRRECSCTPGAGRLAARRQGTAEGVIASDVIEALPAARAGEGLAEADQG